MTPLSVLLAAGIQPTWHEAVAIVQELVGAAIKFETAARFPDLDHIALRSDGGLTVQAGSPVPADPVKHVAGLLQTLMAGAPVPAALQTVVDEARAGSGARTLEDLTKALAFFERPDRLGELHALASRASSVEAQVRTEEELKRLTEKTQQASASGALEPAIAVEPAPAHEGRWHLWAPVLVTVFVVAVAIAAGLFFWSGATRMRVEPSDAAAAAPAVAPQTHAANQTPPASPVPAPPPSASPAPGTPGFFAKTATAFIDAMQRLMPGRPTVDPTSHAAAEAAAAAPKSERRSAAGSKKTPLRATHPAARAYAPAAGIYGEEVELPEPLPDDVEAVVYDQRSADVQPPIMIRPVMPATPPPDVPVDQLGTFDIVVDENGDVDVVRLISPANRYHERMLVASAKAWKFKPAMKNGHAVRYRMRVRATL